MLVFSDNGRDPLRGQLAFFGLRVPDALRRTTEDRENFCIRRYILTSEATGALLRPIQLHRPDHSHECPDFLLLDGANRWIGIEICEATSRPARLKIKEDAEMAEEFRLDSVDGVVGDLPEKDWASQFLRVVGKHQKSLIAPTVKAASQYEIVVYANTRWEEYVDVEEGLAYLPVSQAPKGRAAVHLMKGNILVFDVFGARTAQTLRS